MMESNVNGPLFKLRPVVQESNVVRPICTSASLVMLIPVVALRITAPVIRMTAPSFAMDIPIHTDASVSPCSVAGAAAVPLMVSFPSIVSKTRP